jgi:hypothetical protein
LEDDSLGEVLSANPVSWISRARPQRVAGIVFALRFAHILGLLHDDLTGSHILLNFERCIQILDARPILLKVGENESEEGTQLENFSGE